MIVPKIVLKSLPSSSDASHSSSTRNGTIASVAANGSAQHRPSMALAACPSGKVTDSQAQATVSPSPWSPRPVRHPQGRGPRGALRTANSGPGIAANEGMESPIPTGLAQAQGQPTAKAALAFALSAR